MLLKLIKHELRFSYKEFLIFCGILNALLILSGLIIRINFGTTIALGMILFVICIIGSLIYILRLIYRFVSSNIFSEEGYLTLLLPTSIKNLIFAKLIVGSLWLFIILISFCFGVILFIAMGIGGLLNIEWGAFTVTDADIGILFKSLLDLFVGSIYLILLMLFIISLFYTFKKRSYKGLKLILMFIGLSYLKSVIDIVLFSNLPSDLTFLTSVPYIIIYFFLSTYLIDKKIDLFN